MKLPGISYRLLQVSLVSLLAVLLIAVGWLGQVRNEWRLAASACTWVTTSCGSGCSDNKDIYNCSQTVTIQSVSPSNTNPDSNTKAQYVAPPTVTQYIPPSTTTQTTQAAIDYIKNTAGQTVGTGVVTIDQTGLGGNILESVGQVPTVLAQPVVNSSSIDGQVGNFFCAPNSVCHGSVNSGGAPFVVACDCNGDGKTDRQAGTETVTGSQAAAYCSQVMCAAPGSTVTWGGRTYTKGCEPGSLNCIAGTGRGYTCADNGSGFQTTAVNAHGCGYVGCGSGPGYNGYIDRDGDGKYDEFDTSYLCGYMPPSIYGSRENMAAACKNTLGGTLQTITVPNSPYPVYACTKPALSTTTGRVFIGCNEGGTGNQNCYRYTDKSVRCFYEPGLSCSSFKGGTTVTAVSSTVVVNPTPTPTATPTAACGQACGSNGSVCTGNNIACVDNVCRSTLCAVSEQDASCVCQPPPPVAPICLAIFASKTDIKLNDEVTLTCGQVANAERYEFRYAFSQKKIGLDDAVITYLNSATVTSNVSVPFKADKIGRYIGQCRPCAANNLCQEWEPITGQIAGPTLAPAQTAAESVSTSTSTESTQTEETAATNGDTTATGSAESTATESGSTQ